MMRRFLLAALLLALCGPAGADTTLRTRTLDLSFDAAGNIVSAIACFPACKGEAVKIQQFADAGTVRIRSRGNEAWTLTRARSEGQYELRFEQPSGAVRIWAIPEHGYRIGLDLSGAEAVELHSGESFRPRPAAGFGNWLEQVRYVAIEGGDVRQIGLEDEAEPEAAAWQGYRNRYWALVAAAPAPRAAVLHTGEGRADAVLEIPAGKDGSWSFYIGPVEPRTLQQAGAGLSSLLYSSLWFWLRWICFGLFYLLIGIQSVVPSWGLAIMALSVAVNILMYPLARIADRFQQEVNETEARIGPEIQRIKKQYKGEEQSAKILALYKTERVHPLYSLKSLMGVAVVIPVFIGAFDMLAANIHLLNESFLWIADLSRPDDLFRMPFTLPFLGAEFNLLPFLMTGLSFTASWLHKPPALTPELRAKQVRNMVLLAVVFFVLFYTFPSGMVLYWTTNNLISVIKSLWARR